MADGGPDVTPIFRNAGLIFVPWFPFPHLPQTCGRQVTRRFLPAHERKVPSPIRPVVAGVVEGESYWRIRHVATEILQRAIDQRPGETRLPSKPASLGSAVRSTSPVL